MRVPLALATAATAVAAVATPSHAMFTPYCTTRLVEAATGAGTSCLTQTQTVLQGNPYRTMRIVVLSGAVDATLRCPYDAAGVTVRVSGFVPGALEAFDNGYTCTASIVAVVDHTTAFVTSTQGNKSEPVQ
jgi:hypothetical protein